VYIASLPWLDTDLTHVSNSDQLYVPGLISTCAQLVFVSHSRTPPNGTVGKCEALIWLILNPKKLGGRLPVDPEVVVDVEPVGAVGFALTCAELALSPLAVIAETT
jgi:hypothetical protein